MQTEFNKINVRYDAVDTKIDHLTNAVDAYPKQTEIGVYTWKNKDYL